LSDVIVETDRLWVRRAVETLEAEGGRSSDTRLIALPLSGFEGIEFYFKDESAHPTGSLKHRLAQSLIVYGICNGLIGPDTVLVEASSGSTAVSEAYYARLLGLKFYAVLPRSTSASKVEAIREHGGHIHFVDDPAAIYQEAQALAERENGYYLDQFTYAERATDWRGTSNIAACLFEQMAQAGHKDPKWMIMSAGTGGTAATIGRYILYNGLSTKLCVPDPEHSAFFDGWVNCDPDAVFPRGSRIEGIGRPRVEPSFVPNVIDAMVKIPDATSIAAAHVLSGLLGRRVGASTGTNFIGMLWAADQMRRNNERGPIATLICDHGERYADTYYSDTWLDQQGFDIAPAKAMIERSIEIGQMAPDLILGRHEKATPVELANNLCTA